VLERDVGKFGSYDALADFAPQAGGLQHVRLVDRGELATALTGEARGGSCDPLDLLHGVRTDIDSTRGIAALLAKVDPTRQLAQKHEVDTVYHFRLESRRARQAGQHLHWAQIGVDAELFPQLQQPLLGANFRSRCGQFRTADRAEQYRVGAEAALECR